MTVLLALALLTPVLAPLWPAQVLESQSDFLHAFGLVIATQLPTRDLLQVANICASRRIPLIAVHTYGLMGYLRIVLYEHPVIEAHPDHAMNDLRVLTPPIELLRFIEGKYGNMDALPNHDYAHIPYVVLLIRAVTQWSAANGGQQPTVFKQKKEVRAIIESYRRSGLQADQNIEEALAAVNTALCLPVPSSSVAQLLARARARLSELASEFHSSQKGADDSPGSREQLVFWLMAAALAVHVSSDGNGMLPCVGTLPDMTADTQTYVKLQEIYSRQAHADVLAVQAHVASLAALESLPGDLVSLDKLKLFCKNAHHLGVHSYESLAAEYAPESKAGPAIAQALDADNPSCGLLYILLRAAQAFRGERGHWPGANDGEAETDVPVLKTFISKEMRALGLNAEKSSSMPDDWITEFCRWGGAELHNIDSVMGGIAAQEAIKAVTRQYVPLNNTFIFDGSNGVASTLEL